jgi:hypothetical protein
MQDTYSIFMPLKRSGFKKRRYSPLKTSKPMRRYNPERMDLDEDWANAVLERDGYRCRWPTGPHRGTIVAHHINERSQRPDLIHDVDNGAALCASHHDYAHHTVEGRREATALGLLGGVTYEAAMKAGRITSTSTAEVRD